MVTTRSLLQALAAAALLSLPVSYVFGARNPELAASLNSGLELVVFEADGCVYCEVLRRDAAPLYRGSAPGRQAPLRFVNVNATAATDLGLAGAITIAPTAVLLRDGREAGRITGYWGPETFVGLVSLMIGRVD